MEVINADRISCPKSIAIDRQGKLYTGTVDGQVVCVVGPNFESNVIANFPNGRPLGMRISSKDVLYFIEGNSGLYSLDLNTKQMKLLLGMSNHAKQREYS